jgi:DNA-binding NtrC family response regulator
VTPEDTGSRTRCGVGCGTPHRVLLVDDEPAIRVAIRDYLAHAGFDVTPCASLAATQDVLASTCFDIALADHFLPDGTALDLLKQLHSAASPTPLIILTGQASVDLAVRAIREGAEHFLTKPCDLPSLLAIVTKTLEQYRNTRVATATRRSDGRASADLFAVGGEQIQRLRRDAERVAASDAPILIQGETGSGKGVLARWLHDASRRADEPFIDINCAGLLPDLLEAELFGYERGAFTGATTSKIGLIEAADRGTMFLDEIGDMPLVVQAKLLKVIEEKSFRRMGDVRARRVNVRFITATHHGLPQLVAEKLFRQDLFFRINTITLRVPSLQERSEDVPALAAVLLQQLARELRCPPPRLDADAEDALRGYHWPGNVRELRNVLERALLLARHPRTLGVADLRLSDCAPAPAAASAVEPSTDVTLQAVQWQHIQRVLAQEGGSVSKAAKRLDVPRSSLYEMLRRGDGPKRREHKGEAVDVPSLQ